MNQTVKRVLQGDKESFREIVIEHGPAVRAVLASRIYDPDTIDDLAQETFISAYKNLEQFDPNGDLCRWIKGIARNKVNMHLRWLYRHTSSVKKMRAHAIRLLSEKIVEKSDGDRSLLITKLRRCVRKLKGQVSRIVQLRYFGREDIGTIAGMLDTSESTVSVQLHRGRKQLETCMKKGN